jgi:hypothetical protein
LQTHLGPRFQSHLYKNVVGTPFWIIPQQGNERADNPMLQLINGSHPCWIGQAVLACVIGVPTQDGKLESEKSQELRFFAGSQGGKGLEGSSKFHAGPPRLFKTLPWQAVHIDSAFFEDFDTAVAVHDSSIGPNPQSFGLAGLKLEPVSIVWSE